MKKWTQKLKFECTVRTCSLSIVEKIVTKVKYSISLIFCHIPGINAEIFNGLIRVFKPWNYRPVHPNTLCTPLCACCQVITIQSTPLNCISDNRIIPINLIWSLLLYSNKHPFRICTPIKCILLGRNRAVNRLIILAWLSVARADNYIHVRSVGDSITDLSYFWENFWIWMIKLNW